MSIKQSAERISLGPFITTILVLVIVVISVIFAAVSQMNGSVLKSTEEHAVSDMKEDADTYAFTIDYAMKNGINDLDDILGSEAFTYKIVFVTDESGAILAKSDLAKYTITENNIFVHFDGCEYLGGDNEDDIRERVKHGENYSYSVKKDQNEYLVTRSLNTNGLRLFYMIHQGEVERVYSESKTYLKTVKSLGIAYVTATVGLVILMGSYIFSVVKSSELKLKLSDLSVKNAQEQVRTYSDITRVLSQSYEKVYYVNLSNDRYRVFISSPNVKDVPIQYEGENFWSSVCDQLCEKTLEEDRDSLKAFLNKQNLPEMVRNLGIQRIRFRMMVNGVDTFYYAKAFPSESDGQRYLILGLKNVDALVIHDMNQLAEKEAALRRVDIYRSALLDNMIAYVETNLTEGGIEEGPFIIDKKKKMHTVILPASLPHPLHFDDLAQLWCRQFCKNPQEESEYVQRNSCSYLRQKFENGHSFFEINYNAKWFDGTEREIRQNYYMSKREEDGTIVALCVLYDMTEKNLRDREIENLTEELNQSRIKISTGQMQPHFLYNVLGSIREIILEDPQYASDLICDFTTHLRACIKSMSNDDLIPFSREIENIKAYVNIEKMRFGDRMTVNFDIRSEDFDVVPLSIQPIVENAIRHGIYPKKNEMGYVDVSSYREGDNHVIVVKDNGVGFDYEKVKQEILEHKRDSTGLLNLTLRLEKVLNAKVHFDSRIGEGTTVTILIPITKEGTEQ